MLTNYLVLHPYYKLAYIKMAWGGAKEENMEREAGNIIAWWAVSTFIPVFCYYIYLLFYKNILRNIQPLPILLWISVQSQQHLYPASGSFQQVLKLPQIVDHALVQIDLSS